MIVNKEKLDIVLARRQVCMRDLRDQMSPCTISKINNGKEVRVKTVGKLAHLLKCDPTDLVDSPRERVEASP